MKYYIDFDHTLYNTNSLISEMLSTIANYILKNGNFNEYPKNFKKTFPNIELIKIENNLESIITALKANFGRPKDTTLHIPYNILSLLKVFTKLFDCNYFEIESIINEIIDNGQKFLYDDSIKFLSKLKELKNEVYILSHDGYDLNLQIQKIKGSGLIDNSYIDAIIVTKESKANLTSKLLQDTEKTMVININSNCKKVDSIDYENGIFIDDRPKDLERLYFSIYKNEKPPFKTRIYRMERPNGTYSNVPLNLPNNDGIKVIKNFEI